MIIEMRLAKSDVVAVKASLKKQGIAVNAATIRAVIFAYGAHLNEMSGRWLKEAKQNSAGGASK